MSIITKALKQTACYWAVSGTDRFGKIRFAAPVEIACRWESKVTEVVTPFGERVTSGATVMVGEDVAVGGMLVEGTLDSIQNPTDPVANGAAQILVFTVTPNLRATQRLRIAYL